MGSPGMKILDERYEEVCRKIEATEEWDQEWQEEQGLDDPMQTMREAGEVPAKDMLGGTDPSPRSGQPGGGSGGRVPRSAGGQIR